MTTQQEKIEAIRIACIAANPQIMELGFGCEVEIDTPKRYEEFATEKREKAVVFSFIPAHSNGEDWEGHYLHLFLPEWNETNVDSDVNLEEENDDGYVKILGRPIRLADVLLALLEMPASKIIGTKTVQELYAGIGLHWVLTTDDLCDQSEETVEFLYQIFK